MENSDYKYKRIADLREGDRDVNVFGVVKYYREPIKTSTGQFNAIYTLVDPTVKDDLEKGIRCNLFADTFDKLPQVSNVGDIIRFHRVFIKFFNGRLQMQANKKSYSWVVFPKENIDKPKSSHPNFTMTPKDRATVKEFRQFLEELEDMENDSLCGITLLKDFSLNTYVNCTVQVVSIYKFENDPNYCVLRVSDGTKVNYSSFRHTGKIDNDSPLSWNDNDLVNATNNHSFEISLFDEHVKILDNLQVSDYILITNLHVKGVLEDNDYFKSIKDALDLPEVEDSKGWAECIVHSGHSYNRGVIITDRDKSAHVGTIETRVLSLMKGYRERQPVIIDKTPRPLQESLTTTDYPSQVFVSIATVVQEKIPNKHRIRGKLLAVKPTKVKDFVIKMCNACNEIFPHSHDLVCPNCPESELNVRYFFELLVEDETGLLGVEVYGDEAEYFLNNISPESLLADNALMENIEIKLEKIFHKDHDPKDLKMVESLPWIEVCLLSFGGSLNDDSVTYRVFGTSLI